MSKSLPIHGQEPERERTDAARNRLRILEAAERLFAEQGYEAVTMEAVCVAAGVGKGTLFRRFTSKAGLALALLDERESELQEAALRGKPPLGPAAPPEERLRAFLTSLADLLEAHLELHRMSEAKGARFRSGRYAFYRRHLALLLTQTRPDLDAEYMSDTLLAVLDAELYHHQREQGMTAERIRGGLLALVDQLVSPVGDNLRHD